MEVSRQKSRRENEELQSGEPGPTRLAWVEESKGDASAVRSEGGQDRGGEAGKGRRSGARVSASVETRKVS